MKSIAVYCGSSAGTDVRYREHATQVGQTFAQRGITLVYGGGNVGLMGAVADATMANGGQAIGIIPGFLADKEVAHLGLTQLEVVDNMHQRKLRMVELAEGFIAMPGGFGTLEELFEVLTWGQLGLHRKPIGLLNVAGFYDALIHLLEHMVLQGLLRSENRRQLLVADNVDELLAQMNAWQPSNVEKWLTPSRT
ncbi:TIGR00730 family Rossman fold protein [Hymenobacter oligotrophus]|uniref:Cytokinin riboside 5'-monophosphate phosphoribohydrolase n=1 Tax=Hymenobacter oligotrophus TaxID=2319843 RepID=A0A3B7QWU6_9BACT|nr:TIGR00730 family Rossman fold protein [Hymenobacter oligotrophus]AYA35792.1 TIGR00730 family Rossman fold protein [Hymenobacter oligotrophus]